MELRETVAHLRVADVEVIVETTDPDFAAVVRWCFRDLMNREHQEQAGLTHHIEVRHRARPWSHWGIWRDGEPCETVLDEGYVLFQLQWELNRVVLERRRCTIHAAAVALDGRCIVLCGSTMSGKTTLAGWMAAHGAGYVADEIVALTPDGLALDYHRPLGVRHGGPLDPLFTHPDDLDRRFDSYEMLVPVSALQGGAIAATPLPVAAVVFPQYEVGAPTALTTVPKSEALTRLCDNSPGFGRHGRSVILELAHLVKEVPTVALVSSDMSRADELLRALVHDSAVAS